jgi:hypothetical protein
MLLLCCCYMLLDGRSACYYIWSYIYVTIYVTFRNGFVFLFSLGDNIMSMRV